MNTEQIEVWKLGRWDVHGVTSYIKSRYSVQYRIGETTYPRIGSLFAFKNKVDLYNFAYRASFIKTVCMCGYTTSIIDAHNKAFTHESNLRDRLILNYWTNAYNEKLPHAVPGTIFIPNFTPIEMTLVSGYSVEPFALTEYNLVTSREEA